MPKNKFQRPAQFDFDLICIGSGVAGGSAAVMAARSGKRVALIEGGALGGNSPNYSCIPTNAFLQVSKNLAIVRSSFDSGVEIGRATANWQRAMDFKNQCIKNTGVLEGMAAFEKLGITLFKGFAKFTDPWTINIARQYITGQNIIIATGASDFIPQIEGLKKTDFITFREAFDLPEAPSSLFIIGGGATGCSLAEIFQSFNSRVYLAEIAGNLLRREDMAVGQIVTEIFKGKGIHVLTGSEIVKIARKPKKQKEITIRTGGEIKNIIVDKILIAAGRIPQVDLNLSAAEVKFDNLGIKTNRYLETTMNHIYAIGDVVGHDMLTHLAAYHSRLAIHNMNQTKAKDKISLDYAAIPRYLPFSPAVAATGLTEEELIQRQVPYKKAMVAIHGLDRSYLSNQQAGFVKILCTPDNKLVGGSIIAPEAAEMITQLGLAINSKLSASDLKNNIKAFTTWSEAFDLACQQLR